MLTVVQAKKITKETKEMFNGSESKIDYVRSMVEKQIEISANQGSEISTISFNKNATGIKINDVVRIVSELEELGYQVNFKSESNDITLTVFWWSPIGEESSSES